MHVRCTINPRKYVVPQTLRATVSHPSYPYVKWSTISLDGLSHKFLKTKDVYVIMFNIIFRFTGEIVYFFSTPKSYYSYNIVLSMTRRRLPLGCRSGGVLRNAYGGSLNNIYVVWGYTVLLLRIRLCCTRGITPFDLPHTPSK